MNIAISGAHKTGKTTLAEALLEHLPGYTLHQEPYYELEASGYLFSAIPDVDDFIHQFEYSVKQIRKGNTHNIYDRCPLDLLAYIHALDPSRNIASLFDTAQTTLSEIDLLVFVPIETPDVTGDKLSDLPKLRAKVNAILENWIWDLGIDVIEVSGTISDRRDQLLQKIIL